MLEKESTQIKVGIFVFVGLIIFMYVIFMLGSEKQMFESRYTLYASFKDISGLRVGAPVQLAGYKVGFVDKVSFSTDPTKKEIELKLKVNKSFQNRIRKDSVATINTQGLLGDKFVYISIGSETEPMLTNGDILTSEESASMLELAEKGSKILDDVKEAGHSARKFFEDMYTSKEEVRQILHSMSNTMKEIEKGQGLIHTLIYDPKGKEVVADLGSSLNMLKNIIGRVDKTDQENGEISGILVNLRKASKDLEEIMDKVNRGEGTVGGLVTDPAIYNDLRSLMGRANRNKLLKSVVRSTLSENDKNISQ